MIIYILLILVIAIAVNQFVSLSPSDRRSFNIIALVAIGILILFELGVLPR